MTSPAGLFPATGAAVITAWAAVVLTGVRVLIARAARRARRRAVRGRGPSRPAPARQHLTRADFALWS